MDAFAVRDGQPFAADVSSPAFAERIDKPIRQAGSPQARLRNSVRQEGDLLAVRSVGAYGFVMNSNDNTRGRAAEVLANSSAAHSLRRHATRPELFAGESLLPD